MAHTINSNAFNPAILRSKEPIFLIFSNFTENTMPEMKDMSPAILFLNVPLHHIVKSWN